MIDRKQIVTRHFPKYSRVDALAPLSIGNGHYAFTADITGLQTFPKEYNVPLGHQSEWGWHYSKGDFTQSDINFQDMDTYGRVVSYPLHPDGKDKPYHWLRQNPHRIHLGQIGFQLYKEDGVKVGIEDITNVNQVLNLWEGILYSQFCVENVPVSVATVCHPEIDQISVKVKSSLITSGRMKIVADFPSPDMTSTRWEESVFPNYELIEGHETIIKNLTDTGALLQRKMGKDHYEVNWAWSSGTVEQTKPHHIVLTPNTKDNDFIFSLSFAKNGPTLYSFQETSKETQRYWRDFWMSGGAIDFLKSKDPRARELERRVVLSQFLTAIHGGGSVPSQETGFMYNSWFGKFHLEMTWWHSAHFPLWGREEKLTGILEWYGSHIQEAKQLAKNQGYEGARWPKQIGIDGIQSPSPIAPLLIWQQPHPIYLAELYYQAHPSQEILVRFREMLRETAEFMVSYAVWDEEHNRYVLGPPLIPSQECHDPKISMNPPYELEYWKYGLETTVKWFERLNENVNPKWVEVSEKIATPPYCNGFYIAHQNCPNTFEKYNHDHPSMVAALGILKGNLIDPEIMRMTLQRVKEKWQWDTAWGWDFPMCAMTAARLGEKDLAVDFLLMDVTKNTYLQNGHNYQTPSLSCYLPGNGGLLSAVSMMTCGWEGCEDNTNPGFPDNGDWVIQWEGLKSLL